MEMLAILFWTTAVIAGAFWCWLHTEKGKKWLENL